MSKHTPGPWRADGPDVVTEGRAVTVFIVDYSRTIATNIEKPEAEANARLIAAAPDMLAALRALLKVQDEMDSVGCMPADKGIAQGQARAAIAKAEGRHEPA